MGGQNNGTIKPHLSGKEKKERKAKRTDWGCLAKGV